ncbi:TadE/TadG family type IV pilus assembly protein [Methylobacterium dankookense]|uniref:TadE-like domain-containing protein n=1 Tax=Methylobacterium dankookense TaxID=560405 RepID=A0A564FWN1_9HYPH|nr:TadE/TadG family type IV pilus assembly protein [Methylobacterium dankookense]GJD54375.1 hypothetical protein IFDJLNFL_0246 [Methylobacterium dankookense]VUF12110.1 hypothetical protein MTDSW087_01798 [Methylobacterium dankookense]
MPTTESVRPPRLRRAFLADRRGAAAVEFAILAAPFLALLCVVVESAMMTLSQQTLDLAMDRATRVLRTGEFQDMANGTDPSKRLQRLMCGGMVVFFRCDDLKLDLTRSASFSTTQVAVPYDSQRKNWAAGFGTNFQCPQGDDVVALRAAVPVLRLFGFLDFTHQSMGGNLQLLVATAIFRTEPYSGKSCV